MEVSQDHAVSARVASLDSQGAVHTLREALRLLWSVADGYAKRRVLLALAFVAGAALLAALTPLALKLAVDSFAREPGGALLGPIALVGSYVVGQYLVRCFTEMRLLMHGQAEQRVRRRVGRRLFEHLLRLPMRFHLERRTGAIGQISEKGLQGYELLLTHLIYTIAPVTIELAAVAIVLANLDHSAYLWILALAAIAYLIAFERGAAAIQEPASTISSAHIDAHAVLTDSLLNYETVKYFDAEPVVCTRYDRALGRTEAAWRRFYRSRTLNGLLIAGIFGLSLGLSLLYAARDVASGVMTVGDFVLVNAYVVRLAQPLEMLGFAIREIAQGIAFLEQMLLLFRQQGEAEAPACRIEARAACGELAFERVSFAYRHDRPLLTDVSFRVPAGRTVAIVGVSGSGKSSLIRLLFRLFEVDAGEILLDGQPISSLPLSHLRRSIAVVPQDTVLFHDTIANNIGLGRRGSTQAEIEEAARIARLHELIIGLPEGYETVVGERGVKLSGGERQRVAIARAALKQPRIFVFDEATSSLDSRTEREILSNLVEISRQSTTLIIAHRLSTVVHADEILVLEAGRIVERGGHRELLSLGGCYASLWQAQQGGGSTTAAASWVD